MMNLIRIAALFFIFFVYGVYAQEDAQIKGSFYNFYTFERINNVVLEINTTPPLRLVITNGYYLLNLSPGCYRFKVYTTYREELYASEDILCFDAGDVADYDFILFPYDELSQELIDVSEEISISYGDEDSFSLWWLMFFIVLLLIPAFVFSYIYFHTKRVRSYDYNNDEYMKKLVSLLKENRRMVQKEIVKEMRLSEAKVSLMLTELEDRGLIKKIKKGRSNIVYWKGD